MAFVKIGGFWRCQRVIHGAGIFQGSRMVQELLTQCCKERGSFYVRFLPPRLLSQICADTIDIRISYLFLVNLDESLTAVFAF